MGQTTQSRCFGASKSQRGERSLELEPGVRSEFVGWNTIADAARAWSSAPCECLHSDGPYYSWQAVAPVRPTKPL